MIQQNNIDMFEFRGVLPAAKLFCSWTRRDRWI